MKDIPTAVCMVKAISNNNLQLLWLLCSKQRDKLFVCHKTLRELIKEMFQTVLINAVSTREAKVL